MSGGGLRVLVVAGREPWPLNSGNRLHLFHVLRELATTADVTLALAAPPVNADQLPVGVRVLPVPSGGASGDGLTLPQPLPEREGSGRVRRSWIAKGVRRHYGSRDALGKWLGEVADPEQFDVVMLNGAVYGQLAPYCRVPFVWNPQDELVLHTLREIGPRSWRRAPRVLYHLALYAAYERWVARRAAATIFVSPVDAGYARRWVGTARIEVVPNGVDGAYFRPDGTPPTPGTLAFVGSLEFPPNVDAICWFAGRVWPALRRCGVARRLLVVGRRPVEAVRRLAEQRGIEVAGEVPDVRPYLARAAVVIVPTRQGGGLKNKILEACAMRRPVVASPRAVGGLSARLGRDLLVAHRPGDWVRQLARLLEHPELADRVANSGYAWVRRAHQWSHTGARFYEILAAATGQDGVGNGLDNTALVSAVPQGPPRGKRSLAPSSARRQARMWASR